MTRADYRCPRCKHIQEMSRSLFDETIPSCPSCCIPMESYFGRMRDVPPMNFGWRGDGHYPTKVDSDIAKFQFTNL